MSIDSIYISNSVIQDRESGLIFSTKDGNPMSTQTVNSQFRRANEKFHFIDSNINELYGQVTLHSLRHTYITECFEHNVPVAIVQKLVGHLDFSTTMNVYTSVFSNAFKDNFDALDSIGTDYFESDDIENMTAIRHIG